MDADEITFTREELYEQVWSKPMAKLGPELGMSDVALGKWCKKLGIPRPGLGYWARLAAGQKPRRPKLPPPPKNLRPYELEVTFRKRPPQASEVEEINRPAPPDVAIPDTLHGAHPVVRQLRDQLAQAKPDHNGLLRVSQTRATDAAIKIGPESVNRLLRLLAGTFEALEQRGHRVELGTTGWENRLEILCCVGDQRVRLTVEEKVGKRPHTPTEQELRYNKLFNNRIPENDGYPSGMLILRAGGDRWADWKHGKLDEMLGHVVIGVEDAAERQRLARIEWERKEQERLELVRQEEIRKLRVEHQQALAKDLEQMAEAWERAECVRAFLRALRAAAPAADRHDAFEHWFTWAERYAASVDPLSKPGAVAKVLEPDLSGLPNRDR